MKACSIRSARIASLILRPIEQLVAQQEVLRDLLGDGRGARPGGGSCRAARVGDRGAHDARARRRPGGCRSSCPRPTMKACLTRSRDRVDRHEDALLARILGEQPAVAPRGRGSRSAARRWRAGWIVRQVAAEVSGRPGRPPRPRQRRRAPAGRASAGAGSGARASRVSWPPGGASSGSGPDSSGLGAAELAVQGPRVQQRRRYAEARLRQIVRVLGVVR